MKRFEFNGYDLSEFLEVEDIERVPLSVNNHYAKSDTKEDVFLYNKADGKDIIVKARYKAPKGLEKNKDLIACLGIQNRKGQVVSIPQMLYTTEPKPLFLGDRDEVGMLYDMCVVDGEVKREDFAYTSRYTIKFHSPFNCSFGPPISYTIQAGDQVLNAGNQDVYPYMQFRTMGQRVEIWNDRNGDLFQFDYPSSGYLIGVDNEKLETRIAGSDTRMDKYLTIQSRWQHLSPGLNRINFTGLQKLRVDIYPRFIG